MNQPGNAMKSLAACLVVLAVLSLTACSKTSGPEAPGDAPVKAETPSETRSRAPRATSSSEAAAVEEAVASTGAPAATEPSTDGAPESSTVEPEPVAETPAPAPRASASGRRFESPEGFRFVGFDARSGGFWLGVYEVTQAQYEAVAGTNPSRTRGESRPVEMVSWLDAVQFANALSRREGLEECYGDDGEPRRGDITDCRGYRLPTDGEWRQAASGLLPDEADRQAVQAVGWVETNALGKHHQVGTKEASAAGLFDLVGNVSEWVHEGFARGGGWDTSPEDAAGYGRRDLARTKRDPSVGFRLARSL